jgi:hypothetical protein
MNAYDTVTDLDMTDISHVGMRNGPELAGGVTVADLDMNHIACIPSCNAPRLDCFVCGQEIPTDTTVVRIVAAYPSDTPKCCYSYWGIRGVKSDVNICKPCWDASTPIPWRLNYHRRSPHIQRHIGAWVLQITSGSRWPKVMLLDRVQCGRNVLSDMSRRRFPSCSNRCRLNEYRQRRKPSPPPDERICRRCRQAFKPRIHDHEYCSNACRQAAYRRRKARAGT